MPKSKEVSLPIRNQIIGLLHGGKHGIREISRMFSLSHTTISSIRKKGECSGDVTNKPRSGRPIKISSHGCRQLKNIVKRNRTSTLKSITKLFNTGKVDDVSQKTVSRNLHKLGFYARKACRKPMISSTNRKKRLAFYNTYKNWSTNEWRTSYSLTNQNSILFIMMEELGYGDNLTKSLILPALPKLHIVEVVL